MLNWIQGTVVHIQHWTANLFSLKIKAEVGPFIAGQFTKLALNVNDSKLQRAYSYVNAPQDPILEFYLVRVSDGALTTALQQLIPGNHILITSQSFGFFTLNEIPDCDTLWMLATGTAIGPYLSMLQTEHDLDRFEKIILVHGVRYAQDLNYRELLAKLQLRYGKKLHIQAVISRETLSGTLTGHIPALIENGTLEQAVGCQIDPQKSHVMLCGNPAMVKQMHQLLEESYHMKKHLRREPGNITSERYW